MDLSFTERPDLAHRLLRWVAENQKKIVFVLCAGLAFFGILAAVTAWQNKRESRGLEALFQAGADPLKLEKVVGDFEKNPAGLIAQTHLATMALDAKNFDGCLQAYEKLYEAASRRPYYRVLALHGLGTCQRGKGDYKASAGYFERAAKEPGNTAALESRLEALRSLALAKDPSVEAGLNTLLQEKNLSPELKDRIDTQLLWLLLQKRS